ncbi:MAG: hypothetical protein DRR06_18800 [Gammaproteobacteria bacterium]|nr:MAG: hypothetical protein DRR06_18800 [Gammaproteobacteria bacterium]
MGVDTHVIVETSIDHGWEAIAEVYWWRASLLFGLIAGVRGGGPIIEPRGLPDNTSWKTERWREDGDLHSFTYLTREELKDIRSVFREKGMEWYGIEEDLNHDGLNRTIRLMNKNDRAVFGFDG